MSRIKLFILEALTVQKRASKHQVAAYSGQMAYFFVLSFFPMLIFTFSVISKLNLNFEYAQQLMQEILPPNISVMIADFMSQTLTLEGNTLLSLSGVFMLYSSSRAVNALQRAINVAHGFEEKRPFFIHKIYAMFYTLMFIGLIVMSLVIPSVGYKLIETLNTMFNLNINVYWVSVIHWIRTLLLPIVYVLVIGSIYMFLPYKTLKFSDVYKGAIFAILASIVTNYLFSTVVLKTTDYSIVYGSLSAMIAFMVWLYALGTILMFGAEINAYEMSKN